MVSKQVKHGTGHANNTTGDSRASVWQHSDPVSGLHMWGRHNPTEGQGPRWETAKEHRETKWQSMHVWMNEADHAFT